MRNVSFFLNIFHLFIYIYSIGDHQQSITSALFNPLGDWIALACQNLGQLVVWEWQSQTYVLKQQGHFNNMTQLAYSPDGMHIASGGDDGKVCFFFLLNNDG